MTKPAVSFYDFGPFRLDTVKRLLLRQGQAVSLTPKAFDLLLALVENSERVLEKSELIERVWPNSFVEESNLTQNISTVRKALGENAQQHQYLVTVPGRGYRFVADVRGTADGPIDLVAHRVTRSRIIVDEIAETDHPSDQGADTRPPGRAGRRSQQTLGWLLALLVVLATAAVVLLVAGRKKEQAAAEIKSIAVLPFRPINTGARDEYFELGMADALITKLSGLRQIIVRPTTSVRKYADIDQDAVAAGKELQVETVLVGSTQRLGDRLRVTVQLVNVSDGRPLWAYKCDDYCTDIFTAQDSISEKVATVLALKLTGEGRNLLAKHYTENNEAYQLYLKVDIIWTNDRQPKRKKASSIFSRR